MASSLFRKGSRPLLQAFRAASVYSPQTARQFSSEVPKSGGRSALPWALGLLGASGGIYYAKQNGYFDSLLGLPPAARVNPSKPFKPDYNAVREAIADILDKEGYDDGSTGPILVRLAWHSSGTYDKESGTGGSNGATMRFGPEAGHGANAGLEVARDLLEPIKKQFPWISYSDLWTLAGAVAVEEMGGPKILWRPGRSDKAGDACPPDGRLPDASQGAQHIRNIFYRMGFNDQEIVALSGAHALGRCHTDRSGYVNPWTYSPTTFSNLYFTELTDTKWKKKKWDGPEQYENPAGDLMMLPTDMVLVWDKKFKKHVQEYAKDQDKFFADFAAAFSKLLELGVPFDSTTPKEVAASALERRA
ncbi:hypothetical protein WJX72_011750 [[Myrmecia] bisecta]|uniref:Cytochrome c peroxidase, mitochondrial n=1 Tax=[Myrmecia] bisecta TaxID=41462 RepID=A0AAW1PHD8_9CHLO